MLSCYFFGVVHPGAFDRPLDLFDYLIDLVESKICRQFLYKGQ